MKEGDAERHSVDERVRLMAMTMSSMNKIEGRSVCMYRCCA